MPELTLSSLSEFTVLRSDPELCDVETALEHRHFTNVTDLLVATPDRNAGAQLEMLFRGYDWRVQSLQSCATALVYSQCMARLNDAPRAMHDRVQETGGDPQRTA